jgi:hypothetical protein
VQGDHPEYFEAEMGEPPRRMRHPRALLAIRPGHRLAEIRASVAAQEPAYVVPIGPQAGQGIMDITLLADGETVGRAQFLALPATVSVDRLHVGMSADEMKQTRPDLTRHKSSEINKSEEIWTSSADTTYTTGVALSNGAIARIWMFSADWKNEMMQDFQARQDKKQADEDAERAAFDVARRVEQERLNRSQAMEEVENLLDRWAAEEDETPRSDEPELGRRLAAWLRADETMVQPLPGRKVDMKGYGGNHPAAEFCC